MLRDDCTSLFIYRALGRENKGRQGWFGEGLVVDEAVEDLTVSPKQGESHGQG